MHPHLTPLPPFRPSPRPPPCPMPSSPAAHALLTPPQAMPDCMNPEIPCMNPEVPPSLSPSSPPSTLPHARVLPSLYPASALVIYNPGNARLHGP